MGLNEKFFASVPGISDDDLKIHLDAANTNSYPGSGNTWYDISGHNNHATRNSATWNSSGYFIFDGSNDYFTTAYKQPSGNQFTYSTTYSLTNTSGRKFLIGDSDSGGANTSFRFALEINGANYRLFLGNGSALTLINGPSAGSPNSFINVTVTISGSAGKLYVNGTHYFNFSYSFGVAGANNYTIGAMGNFRSSSLFNGKISEVRMYTKALDQAGVSAIQ